MGAISNRRGFLVTLLMLTPSTVLIAVFLIAPMVIVIGYSFAGRDAYGGIVPGFTLDSYRELFQPLYIPILIFGVAAVDAAASGLAVKPHLLLLGGLLALFIPLSPIATAAALRQAAS